MLILFSLSTQLATRNLIKVIIVDPLPKTQCKRVNNEVKRPHLSSAQHKQPVIKS